MIDSIYHRTFKLRKNGIFDVKTSIFCYLLPQRNNSRHYVTLLNL